MKYFNAVLLVITVTNVYTAAGACVSCKEVTELFDIINGKLDTIIKNGGGSGGDGAGGGGAGGGGSVCKPLNFQNVEVGKAKLVINAVSGAFGAIADGNDVYITAYFSNKLYRFNQATNPGKTAVSVLPTFVNPVWLAVKDRELFMTAFSGNVYRKNLRNSGSSFEKVITMTQPVGIRWSPDGTKLLVGQANSNILVYNANFQFVTKFNAGVTYARDITFDSNGNIRIATYKNEIRIFDKNTYKLIATKIITGASNTGGLTEHCDGTIIVADHAGKLLFLNKDYGTLKTVTGFAGVGDVAISEDGILYVTDYRACKVYLYDLF